MKEAIGQAISLQMILILVVFLNAFLAFSVNYTKAFRVKNKVINELEQNEGLDNEARNNILDYMDNVGYATNICSSLNLGSNSSCRNGVVITRHCIGQLGENSSSCTGGNVSKYRVYYTVTTYININVPIINRMLNQVMSIFKVQGDTATVYLNGNLDALTKW